MSDQTSRPRRRLGKLSRACLWYAAGFEEVQALDLIANYEIALHRLYQSETPLAAELKVRREVLLVVLGCTLVHIVNIFVKRPSA